MKEMQIGIALTVAGVVASLVLAWYLATCVSNAPTVYERASEWIGSDGRVMGCRREMGVYHCDAAGQQGIYLLICTNEGCTLKRP